LKEGLLLNLKNFNKSTAELRSNLILMGEQDAVLYIDSISVNSEAAEILLTLTKQVSNLTLDQLCIKTEELPGNFKFFLYHPQTNTKTYTFGYYLRDQYLVIK
jgi:hypothetical protein